MWLKIKISKPKLIQHIRASRPGTFPSLNSSSALSSHGGRELADECPLLKEFSIPVFSTLMLSLVGVTVAAPEGNSQLLRSPQESWFHAAGSIQCLPTEEKLLAPAEADGNQIY